MLFKQLLDVYDLLDTASANGEAVKAYLLSIDPSVQVETYPLYAENGKGKTDMVRVWIPGTNGKISGGTAPTIGLLGRLGGIGARPDQIGFVSDGDGALCALALAAKLLDMKQKGDCLEGDVFIATHVCPDAPTAPHKPVPFMGSHINMVQSNREEVVEGLDAILSVDTTKGNRVINHRGFAISNTVMQGYVLSVSNDLLNTMEITTGELPYVFPLATQDITPYGNGVNHLNSILQPATATSAPVVGVAITAQTAVPGCATNASHLTDIENAARFMLQVAIDFGRGNCQFYDPAEWDILQKRYGSLQHLQTFGNLPAVSED